MMDSESLTLTVDEIATTKLAVRALRIMLSVGLGIALPMLLVFALPVVAYLLLALMVLGPILVAAAFFWGSRQDAAALS
jgi:hypothetical protein